MNTVQINKMIIEIRNALILKHGENFLKLPVKKQDALIIKAYFDTITEE